MFEYPSESSSLCRSICVCVVPHRWFDPLPADGISTKAETTGSNILIGRKWGWWSLSSYDEKNWLTFMKWLILSNETRAGHHRTQRITLTFVKVLPVRASRTSCPTRCTLYRIAELSYSADDRLEKESFCLGPFLVETLGCPPCPAPVANAWRASSRIAWIP